MKNAYEILKTELLSDDFISVNFSSKKNKSDELRGVIANTTNDPKVLKVEHRLSKHNDITSINKDDFLAHVEEMYLPNFKQVLLKTKEKEIQILINKKNKTKIITKLSAKNTNNDKNHNREKKYLIPDGIPCDFLIEIGVMEKSGKVKSNYYKKFRQINRFLEMVNDLYKNESLENIHAVDFGCGKSYLTFALYYYFQEIKKVKTSITGIDLKQEVIDHCNAIAHNLKYTGLKFAHGFIHDFKLKSEAPIDFVVTLHACDTATDDAILFSLKHNAKNMIFVPCCQHELNKQLKTNDNNKMLIDSGLFRDRICSLVTDSMRAKLLETQGYKVQIMEFITLEHTAKNVMLRCSKVEKTQAQRTLALKDYQNFSKEWNISPYLEKKMLDQGLI